MKWFREWRARVRRDRVVRGLVDELFAARPDVLAQARLAPRHRNRVNVLEVEEAEDGAITSIVMGIVRHPKAHPLATRGEEVVEILEYRPGEERIEVIGSRNLARS